MAPAIMGFIVTVVGTVIFMNAFATSVLSTTFLASALVVAALAQIAFAVMSKRAGNFATKLLIGFSYIVAAVALYAMPASVRIVVGGMLMLQAFVDTAIGSEVPDVAGREWYLFSAAWSALIGLIVIADVPNSSTWLVAAGVGLVVTLTGVSRIVITAIVADASGKSDKEREAEAELEHISGFGAMLRQALSLFDDVKTREPLDRVVAFRNAVASTRDETSKTIERTKRWGSAWDHASGKLLRGRFGITAEDRG